VVLFLTSSHHSFPCERGLLEVQSFSSNPGFSSFNTAIARMMEFTNFFLKQGTLGSLEGQKFPMQTFSADPSQYLTDAPVAVLINRGTYGAPELTAAAIEDAKRGDVVGERSFGLGSVQKTIELPDGAALLLTVAKYQTAAGKKIQDEAVMPTVVVQTAGEGVEEEAAPPKSDEPLLKAIDLLKAKNG